MCTHKHVHDYSWGPVDSYQGSLSCGVVSRHWPQGIPLSCEKAHNSDTAVWMGPEHMVLGERCQTQGRKASDSISGTCLGRAGVGGTWVHGFQRPGEGPGVRSSVVWGFSLRR